MLGIDFGTDCIRVINLRRRGGDFIAPIPLEIPFSPQELANPAVLGARLANILQKRNWQNKKAVIALPRQTTFIRRFSVPLSKLHPGHFEHHLDRPTLDGMIDLARHSILLPPEELVFDIWIPPCVYNNIANPSYTPSDNRPHSDELLPDDVSFSADSSAGISSPPDHNAITASSGQVANADSDNSDNQNKMVNVLLGAAQKSSVRFCREMAQAAGLKIHSLELRSLACINGLFFNFKDAPEDIIAVVYVEPNHAMLALFDTEGLTALHSVNLVPGISTITNSNANMPHISTTNNDRANTNTTNSHTDDNNIIDLSSPLQQDNSFINQLQDQIRRILNTSKLSGFSEIPQRLYLSGSSKVMPLLQNFPQKIDHQYDIPVTVCDPARDISLKDNTGSSPKIDFADFTPALGAVLDGLEISPARFDFLHLRGQTSKNQQHISWKPFAVAFVLAVCGLSVLWLILANQRLNTLRYLNQQLANTKPQQAQPLQARQKWELFRPYLPPKKGGSRLSYLRLLYEITQLLPDTRDAYITSLEITDNKSDTAGTAGTAGCEITITGKGSKPEVATNFTESLNNSDIFSQAKAGPQTTDATDPFYPVEFSVTCQLKKTAHVVSP